MGIVDSPATKLNFIEIYFQFWLKFNILIIDRATTISFGIYLSCFEFCALCICEDNLVLVVESIKPIRYWFVNSIGWMTDESISLSTYEFFTILMFEKIYSSNMCTIWRWKPHVLVGSVNNLPKSCCITRLKQAK